MKAQHNANNFENGDKKSKTKKSKKDEQNQDRTRGKCLSDDYIQLTKKNLFLQLEFRKQSHNQKMKRVKKQRECERDTLAAHLHL